MSTNSFGEVYIPWTTLLPINQNVLPYGPDGIPFPFPYDMYWVCIVAAIMGFLCAMGIGANDVANSFATSVGSKTLTVLQAMIIAAIFEFSGAVLLGKGTTSTIRKGIVDVDFFQDRPDALMIGMLCAITATATWLFAASAMGFPVSTTHSIIGAIMGFALCMPGGISAVNWGFTTKGFAYNLSAWFIAPITSGIISMIFFFLLRFVVLRRENSFERTLVAFPSIVGFTTFVVSFLVINKAGSSQNWDDALGGPWGIFGVSCGAGIITGLIMYFTVVPRMRNKFSGVTGFGSTGSTESLSEDVESDGKSPVAVGVQHEPEKGNIFTRKMAEKNTKLHTINDDRTQSVHDNAEVFEKRTELAFSYVQVFTACAMAFAHGSNDVANSVGPLASIYGLYNTGGVVSSKAPVEVWVLALGGLGIVIGLGTLGYRVMRALGVKLVKMTPSRGSCIELASAFVVCFGSYAKLPLSTTQVMVGASLGVGFLDGGNKGVNMRFLLRIFFGWVLTFLVAGFLSGGLFSLIFYAPSLNLPLATQNCLADYGVTDQLNITSIVGNKTDGAILVGQ